MNLGAPQARVRFVSRLLPALTVGALIFMPSPAKSVSPVEDGAGDTPAGRLSGDGLRVERTDTGEINLSWARSCFASDTDYEIFAGDLNDLHGYEVITCSTSGERSWTMTPMPGDRYYLVVPRNETREGSYGTDGSGIERAPGSPACLPQEIRECEPSLPLMDIDSGSASPQGQYRWMDVADQLYSIDYRDSYDYTQADVQVQLFTGGVTLQGLLSANHLKPHFAYQVKLVGIPGTPSNEAIGLTGRWWQERWNGAAWAEGQNLNDKGDGSSPNPNDATYLARRDIPDATSPTGLMYKYVGYLVFGYLVTDDSGHATLSFEANASYHVLWKTSQRTHTAQDGPLESVTFDVELPDPVAAYDLDYPQASADVFGEWERLPVGGVTLPAGSYEAELVLTEESFHGSGLAGGWAAAMGVTLIFDLAAPNPTPSVD
jgi:hypothetical protein